MSDKFEDCRECANRRSDLCEDCDMGEHFEEIESQPLRFDEFDSREAA